MSLYNLNLAAIWGCPESENPMISRARSLFSPSPETRRALQRAMALGAEAESRRSAAQASNNGDGRPSRAHNGNPYNGLYIYINISYIYIYINNYMHMYMCLCLCMCNYLYIYMCVCVSSVPISGLMTIPQSLPVHSKHPWNVEHSGMMGWFFNYPVPRVYHLVICYTAMEHHHF